MNGLARVSEQTILIHWIDEGVNTISCLGFAVAAWMLYQHVLAKFGLTASISQLSTTVR